MVHGVSRAALWVFTFSLRLALKIFVIPTRYNCVYSASDILWSLTYISLESEYAEGGLDILRRRLHLHYRHGKVSDSDTLLYRLKQVSRRDARRMLQRLNENVLSMAKRKGAFIKRAVAAIDLTFIPYYGKPTPYVVQGKYKLGTCWFHCYAAIRLVERGRRYVIKSRLVTPLDLSEKAQIVEELVTEARHQGLHVRLLLLDKGFYSHEVIKTLKAMEVKFIIAAPKNNRVKEAILDYIRTAKGQVRRFNMKKGGETVNFNLTIHRLRKKKKNMKNILELYGAFATNMGYKKAMKSWQKLPQDYRKRWGIETGFRVEKGFRAKTTSPDETIREIYHQYAVVLENLWTFHNVREAKRKRIPLGQMRRPIVKVKEFSTDFRYFILTNSCIDPP